MPKVLVCCEFASLNGGEYSMLATLPVLQRAGFRITVAAPEQGPLIDVLGSMGIEHLPLPFERWRREGYSQDKRREELAGRLRYFGPDLVHANSLSMSRLLGPIALQLRLPSLGHLRDILRLSRKAIDDINCNTRLLTVSEATRTWHIAQGLDESRTFTAHNGVDLDRFTPANRNTDLRLELGISGDTFLIGSIGQVGMRKGLDVACKAIASVSENADVCWTIIGKRHSQKDEAVEYERQLHLLASQQPLGGRCHFLGCRDDLPGVLPSLDLLVHAARQEPLGRVLLEGAASGIAIVATDVGGTREIFPASSEAAIVVPADNAPSLSAAISRIMGDSELRNQLGRAARQRAEEAFGIQEAALRLANHYQIVLDTAATG